jgi:hypothetical protein
MVESMTNIELPDCTEVLTCLLPGLQGGSRSWGRRTAPRAWCSSRRTRAAVSHTSGLARWEGCLELAHVYKEMGWDKAQQGRQMARPWPVQVTKPAQYQWQCDPHTRPPLSTLSGNVIDKEFHYELPEPPASVAAAGGFNYPNSNGFQYEALAVQRCINSGLRETPQYTVQESLTVSRRGLTRALGCGVRC